MIGTATGSGRLVITLCNYSKYQDIQDNGGMAAGTATGTKVGQSWDLKEQGNKLTIEEEPRGSSNYRSKMRVSENDFLIWWKAYPRKTAKLAAEKSWQAAVKRGVDPAHLLQAALAYAAHPPVEQQYIPHPSTWLNQGRYDDSPEAPDAHTSRDSDDWLGTANGHASHDNGYRNPLARAAAEARRNRS